MYIGMGSFSVLYNIIMFSIIATSTYVYIYSVAGFPTPSTSAYSE